MPTREEDIELVSTWYRSMTPAEFFARPADWPFGAADGRTAVVVRRPDGLYEFLESDDPRVPILASMGYIHVPPDEYELD